MVSYHECLNRHGYLKMYPFLYADGRNLVCLSLFLAQVSVLCFLCFFICFWCFGFGLGFFSLGSLCGLFGFCWWCIVFV